MLDKLFRRVVYLGEDLGPAYVFVTMWFLITCLGAVIGVAIHERVQVQNLRTENEKLKHSVELGRRATEAAERLIEATKTFNEADLPAQSIAKDGDWYFFLNYDDQAILERIAPDFVRQGKTDEYKIEPFSMVPMEYYEGTNTVTKWEKDPNGISVWTKKNYHPKKGRNPLEGIEEERFRR